MPKTPQEQMAMTPEVYDFTRKFGRGQQVQEKPSVIQQIAGTLGNVALAGAGIAGAYGLARSLGSETDISPVSTGAMSDVGEKYQRIPVRREQTPDTSENYQRIPVRREESAPTTEKYQRTTVLPKEGRNYGKQVGTVGSLQEQPTDVIVVVDDPQPAITTTQQDSRSLLGEFANNLISKAQEEVNAFDAGVDWGDTVDKAASALTSS